VSTINFKDFLYYDESSPTKLRWLVDRRAGKNHNMILMAKDDVAGSLSKNGYYQVRLHRQNFLVHRVILILFNFITDNELVADHIDGNKLNNSISNLRVVSVKDNAKNRVFKKSNTGIPYLLKRASGYRVAIIINDRRTAKMFSFKTHGGEEAAKQKAIEYLLSMKDSMLTSGYTERQIDNIMRGLNDSTS
jgi:hypothetical protein